MAELKNPKNEMFCQEYIKDMNAARAYASVYKTKPTCANSSSRTIMKSKTNGVRARIQELQDARKERCQIDGDAVLREINNIAMSNIADLIEWNGTEAFVKDFDKLPREITACIESMETQQITEGDLPKLITKIKFHNKIKSLDMLMRHLGKYNDK